jgi:dihydroorotase
MTTEFTLPKWYDLHAHFRQDGILAATLADHARMGCAGVLAMPNTRPPVGKVLESDTSAPDFWSIEKYLSDIRAAGGDVFSEIIVPLYITKYTTPKMIEDGAKSGLLKAVKYYPPHGTTGADAGYPFAEFLKNGVFAAMQDAGIILCMHGEEHGLKGANYIDSNQNAEKTFYTERAPQLLDLFPSLKCVAEHLTTKEGVAFVEQAGKNIAATITPQHLIYTVGDLLQGLKYHLYCLPLLKFDADRAALQAAVTNPNNTKFFAGTDSAPHSKKVTECGCAAGCYTGGIAPQMYAAAFEQAGCDLSKADNQKIFEKFLCRLGAEFYGLPIPAETFTLKKTPSSIRALQTEQGTIKPLPLGLVESDTATMEWSIL